MGDQVTEIVPQSQGDEPGKAKRDLNTLQVLGGGMPDDIVQHVALLKEPLKGLFSIQGAARWPGSLSCPSLEYAAVSPGHGLYIDPISQPAAPVRFHLDIRRDRDPRKNTADIGAIVDIQVFEYFRNAPFPGFGRMIQLILAQT